MTKKEILSELKKLDDYFRIHSWCTQMDEKISSFTAALDERGRKHVTRWALDSLEKENLESASQILAIIFLKLNDVPDRELIRLLYTVLSGRLTYEDFNSLNNYIFNGKPPLSADLFYNITERVFIDKKSALKKALSISSIISEADPQLTIFYMTMLLCRVDLNNENKAMLNLLLYCVDADIPDEMAEGIRRSLSENADILEEILSETEDSRVKEITGKVYRNLQDNRNKPEIISIEKKEPESRVQFPEVPESQSPDVNGQEDSYEPVSSDAASVHVAAPGEGSSESQGGSSPAYTVSGEKGAGKPESSLLSGNKFSGRAEKKTESGGTGSPSLEENFSQAENKSFSLEKESAFLGGGYSDTADAPVPRPGNGKDSSGKADKRDVKGKDDAASGISDSVTASAGPGSSGFSGESEPDKGEAVYEDTLPAETERPVKEYRIGVRKFSMKDLASLFKRGERKRSESGNLKDTSVRSAGSGKKDKKEEKKGRRYAGYILLAVLAASGVFAAVVFFSSRTGGKEMNTPPGGDKAVSGQVVSDNTPPPPPPPPPPAAEIGSSAGTKEDAGSILHDRPEWIIKETSSGVEWTVQKGESVWRLYQYLSGNSGKLKGRLKKLGEMDWLPFIHQVIRLNPDKNLALPIEPGDKFIIAE